MSPKKYNWKSISSIFIIIRTTVISIKHPHKEKYKKMHLLGSFSSYWQSQLWRYKEYNSIRPIKKVPILLFDNSRFLKLISCVLPLRGFSFLKGAEQTKIGENKNKIIVFDIKLVFFKYQKSLKNYLYQ